MPFDPDQDVTDPGTTPPMYSTVLYILYLHFGLGFHLCHLWAGSRGPVLYARMQAEVTIDGGHANPRT